MSPISLQGGSHVSPFFQTRELAQPKIGSGAQGLDTPALVDPKALSQGATQAPAFDNVLGTFVREVNAKQAAASDAVTGVLSGQNVPLHQAMIAMEEASVSFHLMVEVRNKLLEGYQELMRMQV